jgi:integrase
MTELVRLKTRPSRDGKTFKYLLDYVDENGKRRRISLGHADKRKAEQEKVQLGRELRMGITAPESMKLSDFLKDSLNRSRGQVREGTLLEYSISMTHFIKVTGDIDLRNVRHTYGEHFVQACLDGGNSAATANKKVRGIKRLFQLAVERSQLEKNPFQYVRKPKSPRRKVRIYTEDECYHLLKNAKEFRFGGGLAWDLLIATALCTGMRRGELLNTTWRDIDFDKQTMDVSPKINTDQTWEWHIKDTERRTLPLTDEMVLLLVQHHAKQPEAYSYVFISPSRYDRIQQQRQQGKWTV